MNFSLQEIDLFYLLRLSKEAKSCPRDWEACGRKHVIRSDELEML